MLMSWKNNLQLQVTNTFKLTIQALSEMNKKHTPDDENLLIQLRVAEIFALKKLANVSD